MFPEMSYVFQESNGGKIYRSILLDCIGQAYIGVD